MVTMMKIRYGVVLAILIAGCGGTAKFQEDEGPPAAEGDSLAWAPATGASASVEGTSGEEAVPKGPAVTESAPPPPAPIEPAPPEPVPPIAPGVDPAPAALPSPSAEAPPSPAKAAAAVLPNPSARASPFTLELEPTSGGERVEVPVETEDSRKEVALGRTASAAGEDFSLVRFVPSIALAEKIEAAGTGQAGFPALHLVVDADGSRSETWMSPGSRLLGKASFRSVLVEYHPALPPADLEKLAALLQQIYAPTPKVVLELKRDGRRFLIPAAAGKATDIEDPPYRFEILRILNCFSIDPKTGEAAERDNRPLNPAVQVRVTHRGTPRTVWLFSQFPEFSRDAEDDEGILRFVWPVPGHPHQRADMTIVDDQNEVLKAFLGVGGDFFRVDLPLGKEVLLFGLKVTAAERIPSASVVQKVGEGSGGPAVLLRWTSGERWIPAGAREEIRTGKGSFIARLYVPSAQKGTHGVMPASHTGTASPQTMPSGHPALPEGHPAVPGADAAEGSGGGGALPGGRSASPKEQ